MVESACFGKLYSAEEPECQEDVCGAVEECKKVMLNVDEKKLSCFGKPAPGGFDPENYACTALCTKNVACQEEQKRLSGADVRAAVKGTPKEVKKEPVKAVTKEPEPVVVKSGIPPEVLKTAAAKVVTPKAVTSLEPTGKVSKKSVVRNSIRELKRFTADDLVQAIVDAKLGEDSEADRKKNRNLVTMWISEFKREHMFNIEKDGNYYVVVE